MGSAGLGDHLRYRPSRGRRPLERRASPGLRGPVYRRTPGRHDLVVPATVVAEVGYLLCREAGPRVEGMFLTSMAEGDFASVELTPADYARMAELVETYANLPLGTTDASVIALSERLGTTEIATLDRRHFSVVRPDPRQSVDAPSVSTTAALAGPK
jgi:predicted nucleic acid-binding protein